MAGPASNSRDGSLVDRLGERLDELRRSVAVPVLVREGITLDDLLERLRDEVAKVGQQAWARQHDLSPQYLNDVLKRRREPGPKILKAMQLRAETRYLKDPPPAFRGGGILP